jgi:DNA polymerase/3'-5' exonuclease PolX
MLYNQALQIAQKYLDLIFPHCERGEIAGSIRRKKLNVKDIELVVIPKKMISQMGLFENEEINHPLFVETIHGFGNKKKGDAKGRYIQILLPEGIKLDLFTATKENWGLIFAIRTGSANFSHNVLAATWSMKGFKSINGMLHNKKTGKPIPLYKEQDLFDLLGLKWRMPEERF